MNLCMFRRILLQDPLTSMCRYKDACQAVTLASKTNHCLLINAGMSVGVVVDYFNVSYSTTIYISVALLLYIQTSCIDI